MLSSVKLCPGFETAGKGRGWYRTCPLNQCVVVPHGKTRILRSVLEDTVKLHVHWSVIKFACNMGELEDAAFGVKHSAGEDKA